MTSNKKHPWTHWAILIYGFGMAVLSFMSCYNKVPYPKSGWWTMGFISVFLVLYWFDGIIRADRDVKYRNKLLMSEVRQEVVAELNRRERKAKGIQPKGRVVDAEAEEQSHPLQSLADNMQECPPDYAEAVKKNFWSLVDTQKKMDR